MAAPAGPRLASTPTWRLGSFIDGFPVPRMVSWPLEVSFFFFYNKGFFEGLCHTFENQYIYFLYMFTGTKKNNFCPSLLWVVAEG